MHFDPYYHFAKTCYANEDGNFSISFGLPFPISDHLVFKTGLLQ